MPEIENKVVAITGASTGKSEATALPVFREHGSPGQFANVISTAGRDRRPPHRPSVIRGPRRSPGPSSRPR
jgi:NADP-dependent 3-hydroxy acid dehydrogenase YdfG